MTLNPYVGENSMYLFGSCRVTFYNLTMLAGFRHKGLIKFFEDDGTGQLPLDLLELSKRVIVKAYCNREHMRSRS